MNKKVLVAYASRLGSTAGVAEAIGKSLADSGAQVDVLPMKDVKSLDPYQAVVAGSAIRDRKWLPEAMQFMETHQAALAGKPVAIFLVCMTLAMPKGEKYRSEVSKWLDPVRTLVKPVSEGLFAGELEVSRIENISARIKFRISVMMGIWKEGDHRNWMAIKEWAVELRAVLLHKLQTHPLTWEK